MILKAIDDIPKYYKNILKLHSTNLTRPHSTSRLINIKFQKKIVSLTTKIFTIQHTTTTKIWPFIY